MIEVVVEGLETTLVEKIKRTRGKNEEVVKVVKEMKKAGVKMLRGDEQKIEGDLVLKEGKMYILKNEKLRLEVIQLHYNVLVTRHGRRWKIIELVTRNHWQPGVTKDIGKYVEECDLCQRMKNKIKTLVEKLMMNEVLKKP